MGEEIALLTDVNDLEQLLNEVCDRYSVVFRHMKEVQIQVNHSKEMSPDDILEAGMYVSL